MLEAYNFEIFGFSGIKQVEVTGEKSPEIPEMRKQRKLSTRKSIDHTALLVPCRDLGRADHEGWLSKKGRHCFIDILNKETPYSYTKRLSSPSIFWTLIICNQTSFTSSAHY